MGRGREEKITARGMGFGRGRGQVKRKRQQRFPDFNMMTLTNHPFSICFDNMDDHDTYETKKKRKRKRK